MIFFVLENASEDRAGILLQYKQLNLTFRQPKEDVKE